MTMENKMCYYQYVILQFSGPTENLEITNGMMKMYQDF